MDAEILALLRRTVVTVVPEIDATEVVPDARLADLGCNSIDRADIVTLVMEELGVQIPVGEFGGDHDVRSLVGLFGAYA
ncbi:MAG: phosphopantetheine-binding protein [Streptosporangiales bacterium]|nr:phosphopantetheine-binding protein [Streptosporangiales bacterium]